MTFAKHGLALSSDTIAGAISSNSVKAAPMGLVKTISAVALAKGAATSASNLTLVKGALKIMAWTKAKTAIVVGTLGLVAATAIVATVSELPGHEAPNSRAASLTEIQQLFALATAGPDRCEIEADIEIIAPPYTRRFGLVFEPLMLRNNQDRNDCHRT
ncbi:MAG: hypothetical protein ACREFR_16485 [Limisphaerales bacterium]